MKKISGPQFAKKATMPTRNMRGFSLLEMMIVVCIGLIMAAITFISLQPALKDGRVNNAYDTALSQMRTARERAVSERTRYIVSFGTTVPPLAIGQPVPTDQWSVATWVWRKAVPPNPDPPPTWVSTIELPNDILFQTVAGLPAAAPDGFGAGHVALDFDQGVGAGGLNYVMFMPDGSVHDELQNYNSGILYMARSNDLYSSRAITVWGVTGRIRGWRLVQAPAFKWMEQ